MLCCCTNNETVTAPGLSVVFEIINFRDRWRCIFLQTPSTVKLKKKKKSPFKLFNFFFW